MVIVMKAQPKIIPDGLHTGTITSAVEREVLNKDYSYFDVSIKVDGHETEIKASYSAYLSPTSKLGQMLDRLGIKIDIGTQLNTNLLAGKRVQFQTVQRQRGDKTYSNVLNDTVKLYEGDSVK